MGYWEEKQKYEQEHHEKDFCNVCGISLNPKNIMGKCVECNSTICKKCGKSDKGIVICLCCIDLKKSVERKPKHLYYIDNEGNVCEQEAGFFRRGEKKILFKIKRKQGFLYVIDRKGNIRSYKSAFQGRARKELKSRRN